MTRLAMATASRRRIAQGAGLALAAVTLFSVAAWAASTTVVQKNRAFGVKTVEIAKGDTIKFANQDEFIHQIYVDSPTMTFDSAEQSPGQDIDLPFPKAGTFQVLCHIHPKMLLTVTVN